MQRYYIDKSSDTSADSQLAVGFAKLLQEVQRRTGKLGKITICDAGTCYLVESTTLITVDDLQWLTPFPLVRPIIPKSKEGEQGENAKQSLPTNGFDYQEHVNNSKNYYAKLRELRGVPNAQAVLTEMGISPPDSSLGRHYQAITQMKIASTFNDLAQRWMALGELQRNYISVLFTLFQTPDNDIDTALDTCQTLVKKAKLKQGMTSTALQIINPTTGKGANRAKANGLADSNLDSFWPLELLKFVGFMVIAAPYTIQGSKDRKTYVLQPKRIELSKLEGIMNSFRAVCWSSTAVKLDVMTALRFTETFIEHHRVYLQDEQQEENEFSDEEQVSSVAHGFEVASYKDMGSAYATMNISTINFPQWLTRLHTHEDAEKSLALLREHRSIIQGIRTSKGEEGSEEYELLRAYRDFLSGQDLAPLWRFTTAYSAYLTSQREHEKNFKRWLRQLSTEGLEQIIEMTSTTQAKPLSRITSNPGFQRIARAIRQATVRAQYQRSQERDREVRYDVHYGLGLELAREARYRDKFLNTLSDFLMRYNAETAREEEKLAIKLGGGRITPEQRSRYKLRSPVDIEDLNKIIELMDEFGDEYEMVARLLIAYGYASESRGKSERHAASEEDKTSPQADESLDTDTGSDESNE